MVCESISNFTTARNASARIAGPAAGIEHVGQIDSADIVTTGGARLDETKAGSGLGLAISRDLARLYGGELELMDGPAGGLLARLTLPEAVAP